MTMIQQERASRMSAPRTSTSGGMRDRLGSMGRLGDYLPQGGAIMRAARERPEALLVIAAGLALLMRGGGASRSRGSNWGSMSERELRARGLRHNLDDDAMAGWASSGAGGQAEGVGERVREAGERMTSYASEMGERVSEAASGYASAAGRWVEDARGELSERSTRLADQARALPGELDDAVRDHPLVLAALGVAVGAALGASLPASSLENRAMGGARDQLGEAAQGMAGRLTDAAERALEEAKRSAERHGVSGESVRDVAREAASAFASTAIGREQREGEQRTAGERGGGEGSSTPRA